MLEKIQDQKYIEFADKTLDLIQAWFGVPKDAHWKYKLFWSDRSGCLRARILREYIVGIKQYAHDEQIYHTIAHELYHRCTMLKYHVWLKKGLHRYVWVDEMLAVLTAKHVLYEFGMEEYANTILQSQISTVYHLDPKRLKNRTRRRIPFVKRKNAYPLGMNSTVASIACALERELTWQEFTRIVHCSTWSQWLQSLPSAKRSSVQAILSDLI